MLRTLASLALGLCLLPGAAYAESFIQVSTSGALTSAFGSISNGGVIEVAGGTYASPSGGFAILNPNKTFTVRAAPGATVILDGGGTQLVLRYMSTSAGLEGHVTFEDITFRNGFSNIAARGGGITQERGKAVFVRCIVENNHSTMGGGGYFGYNQAFTWWINSTIRNNTTLGGGAGLRLDIGTTWIHNSTFFQNRNNVTGHANTAVGGGIQLFDAKAYITNSRFENNQSVWAGGAIYGIGTWTVPYTTPKTDIYVANCTFLNNFLSFQSGSAPPTPGEGGGIHIENQVRLRLYNSRLDKNRAQIGGGLSLYRSTAEVEGSVFRGNQATDTASTSGFGGAIKGNSGDALGEPDYPSANITVRDSLIQGRFDTVTTVARAGGGIFIGGDTDRAYGANGFPQSTLEAARADLLLERVIFYDLDVTAAGGSLGGAIEAAMAELTADDVLFAGNDALVAGSAGGAILLLQSTLANITDSAFVANTAIEKGGAIFAKGVELNISNSTFLANAISANNILGASLFTEPQEVGGGVPNIPVTGTIASNIFSEDIGLAIFDSEVATVINDVRYNSNQFFSSAVNQANHSTGSGTAVYGNPIGAFKHSPTSLNTYVVVRPTLPDTEKSQVDNSALGTAPKIAFLLAAPAEILSQVAAGDSGPTTAAFLAWAAGGGSATLDSNPVATPFGLAAGAVGPHTLSVSPASDVATISAGESPGATFGANPDIIDVGQSSDLSWNLTSGTFESFALSNGIVAGTATSGTATVTPPCTTTYRLCLITKEGGLLEELTVYVGEVPGQIFVDGFEGGNTSAWQ